jgi:hypothetical protein
MRKCTSFDSCNCTICQSKLNIVWHMHFEQCTLETSCKSIYSAFSCGIRVAPFVYVVERDCVLVWEFPT